ncbi:collagen alpha-6(VI) chain-like [Latimeria chalumnae]|uniref:collagen alpha-6(VI) chain-like n=1 Tax=Latimeria chalumnae TaxID=7897 RepID=UPI00313F10FB
MDLQEEKDRREIKGMLAILEAEDQKEIEEEGVKLAILVNKETLETWALQDKESECPVHPTELVFALDVSSDVTPQAFERMRNIVLSLLEDLEISESNCPTGARVAVVSYNSNTMHLIHFSDFDKKNLLLEAVRRITQSRSSNSRNIGAAMRFVAWNIFKRVRKGYLMRKVAVFLTNGRSREIIPINTAVLEFSALDIIPVVIAFDDVPNVQRAFTADDTGRFRVYDTRELDQRTVIRRVQKCILCYDLCEPDRECQEVSLSPPPVQVNMDIAFVIDSSRNMRNDDFEMVKDFLSTIVDQITITPQPAYSSEGARVALIQHAPPGYIARVGEIPVSVEFDLLKFNNKNLMKRHIQESFRHLEGSSAIGHAIEWTVNNVFLTTSRPRNIKVIFAVVAGETSSWDRQKLKEVSLKAKCRGFSMFTLALGRETNDTELEELSSFPLDQHLIQLGKVHVPEMEYAQKFFQAFLRILKGKD